MNPLPHVLRRTTPTARPGACDTPPCEALEQRLVLSGTNALVVDATDGRSVTVDGTMFDQVDVLDRANIGTLTVNAAAGGVCVNVMGGARVGSISMNGAAGADQVFAGDGSNIGQVSFTGAGGDDEFAAAGAVIRSDVTFNGGAGNDVLRFDAGTRVVGGTTGSFGAGDDLFAVVGRSLIGNVDATMNAGADRFALLGGSVVGGNFNLGTGDGADTAEFGSRTAVRGNMVLNTDAGDDTVSFERFVLRGNQTVSLGGGAGDSLTFGRDVIQGSSTVNWTDGATVGEDSGRIIEGDYRFNGGAGTSDVTLDGGPSQFSRVIGNFLFATTGRTDLTFGLDVRGGNAVVGTGQGANTGADTVTVLGGTSIGGNAKFTLGGSEADADRLQFESDGGPVRIGDRPSGTNGNFAANLGGGADVVTFDAVTINGNQTIDLGPAPDDAADSLVLGDDTVFGSSVVKWADSASLRESGTRDVRGDYLFQGGDGTTRARLNGGGGSMVGGNFAFTTAGETTLLLGTSVEQGNLNVSTGAGAGTGADTVRVTAGTRVEGNAKFTLGGDEAVADTLRFDGLFEVGDESTGTNGNMTVSVGGGDDTVAFSETTVNGNQTVQLGDSVTARGDVLNFGEDTVNGGSQVSWAGGADIEETGRRMIRSDYVFTGGNRPSDVTLAQQSQIGTGSSGNLTVNHSAKLDLRADVQVLAGNATVQPGAGGDRVDLRGSLFRGNLNVSTASGGDLVLLRDARVEGNSGVSLSGDDDRVDNAGFTVVGTPTFSGGAGTDVIADPTQGNVSGFEA